jgi:hypothetical protein
MAITIWRSVGIGDSNDPADVRTVLEWFVSVLPEIGEIDLPVARIGGTDSRRTVRSPRFSGDTSTSSLTAGSILADAPSISSTNWLRGTHP